LVETIINWNTTKKYNIISCSCQDFVQDLLKHAEIHYEPTGPIKNYFDFVKKSGTTKTIYTNPFTSETVEFDSHHQLDTYVIALDQECERLYKMKMKEKFPIDWALLKGFDRAFWMRYHRLENKDPLFSKDTCKPHADCPFENPSLTSTFPRVSRLIDNIPATYTNKNKVIKILCLDGGGMRGVALLKMLEAIEAATGKPISQSFDLIAGTSTGGILSYASALDLKISDGLRLYEKLGSQIFGYTFGNIVRINIRELIQRGWYDASKFERLLDESLCNSQNIDLSTLHTKEPKVFCVSATREDNPTPFIFRSYVAHHDSPFYSGTITGRGVSVTQAVRASTAAPLYFSPVTIGNIKYQDGGVVANNPSEIALMEACLLWPDHKIVLVSLGTGLPAIKSDKRSAISKPSTAVSDVISELISIATSSEIVHKRISHRVQSDLKDKVLYHRLNPPDIGDIELSTYQAKILSFLQDSTEQYLKNEGRQVLESIIQSLSQ
jgi:predicted acylesterase/phospholipase RssA